MTRSLGTTLRWLSVVGREVPVFPVDMSLLGRTTGVSTESQNYVIRRGGELADLYEVLSEHKYSCVLLWQQVCSLTDVIPDGVPPCSSILEGNLGTSTERRTAFETSSSEPQRLRICLSSMGKDSSPRTIKVLASFVAFPLRGWSQR